MCSRCQPIYGVSGDLLRCSIPASSTELIMTIVIVSLDLSGFNLAVTVAGYCAVKLKNHTPIFFPPTSPIPRQWEEGSTNRYDFPSRGWEKNDLGVGMAPFAPNLNYRIESKLSSPFSY